MDNLQVRVRVFLKYSVMILFILNYISTTFFYHSHIINKITITHSHFYLGQTDAEGIPIDHSHSQDEYIFIKIVTQFITTGIIGYFFLRLFYKLLIQYQIPLLNIVYTSFKQSGFSLRGPPSLSIFNKIA